MLIEADLHCHSLASTHAYSTIKELAESAFENKLKIFALTDHAPDMEDSPHVWHFHNLEILPRVIKNVTVLKGVEADIVDFSGKLDMSDDDLNDLEWVVASLHRPVITAGNPEENTTAYINAMKNYKQIDVIGHPTARNFPINFEAFVKACREYEKFPELNESSIASGRSLASPCNELLSYCKKYSVPIVVNTDCHYCDIIGKTSRAEQFIRDNDFPEELIFNRKAENIIEYLSEKKNVKDLEIAD